MEYAEECISIARKKTGISTLLNEKKLDLWLNQRTQFVSTTTLSLKEGTVI